MAGALVHAAAAADAGEHAIIIGREVGQLVHEPLAETLHLAVTVVAVGHHGEVRVHTAVPAAEPLDTVTGVVVLKVPPHLPSASRPPG